jgi:hypothetical protein
LFLLHDNAPAHWSVLFKDFLAQTNVTTLEHPHNLLTCLQLIFSVPSTEISSEWTALFDISEVIKNATEELKLIPQNGFQKRFCNTFTFAGTSVYLHKRTVLKET